MVQRRVGVRGGVNSSLNCEDVDVQFYFWFVLYVVSNCCQQSFDSGPVEPSLRTTSPEISQQWPGILGQGEFIVQIA